MIGEAGMATILKVTCDKLVAATIDTAIDCKAIKPAEFERIIVDEVLAFISEACCVGNNSAEGADRCAPVTAVECTNGAISRPYRPNI